MIEEKDIVISETCKYSNNEIFINNDDNNIIMETND